MRFTYQKYDSARQEWVKVKSLDEIPLTALPHVFALQHNEDFECQEPLECAGLRFRAILEPQDLREFPINPLAETAARRLEQAQYLKTQLSEITDRDSRFEKLAKARRDEIQKALVVVMTKLADAFEGSHNERHAKLARAMTQIYEVSALCEKIPDLLRDAVDDIPF